jgi:tetratricopeptide (TPR) repeat protein
VGFPTFKRVERSGTPLRESHQVTGLVPLGSNVKQGLLTLETTAHPPRRRVSESGEELSPWEGMSGSAVFCRGSLIGVITLHRQSEGRASLAAVRVAAVDGSEDVSAADRRMYRRLLGLGLHERITGLAPDPTPDPHAERVRRIEELLVDWPLRLADADPIDLGITVSAIASRSARAGRAPDYVERDVDDEIVDALKSSKFVLLVGPSKAGKSRSALHAAREVFGDDALVVAPARPWPEDGVLRELFGALDVLADAGSARVIVWLDDIGRYIRTAALDAALLRRFRRQDPPVIVLATISDTEREALWDEERVSVGLSGRVNARVLADAVHLRVETRLSSEERERAEQTYPGEDFSIGIGARLVDAPRLMERLQAAPSTSPHGMAIVHAAVDWERSTLTVGVEQDTLWALARLEDYRSLMPPMTSCTDKELERGLTWALQREESGIALLYRIDDLMPIFSAFDYVVACSEGEVEGRHPSTSIPPGVWAHALEVVDDEECLSIGLSAMYRSKYEVAESAFRRARSAPGVEVDAGVLLGAVQRDLGKWEASRGTLEDVVRGLAASGRSSVASESAALSHLALTRLGLHQFADAERDAERAVELAEPVQAQSAESLVLALHAQALILDASGKRTEAIRVTRKGADLSEHRLGEQDPMTAIMLAQLSRLLSMEKHDAAAESAKDLAERALEITEASLGGHT